MSVPQDGAVAVVRHKSKRRKTRDFLLQTLYRRLLSGASVKELQQDMEASEFWSQLDQPFFTEMLAGIIGDVDGLEFAMTPALDRPLAEVSPVERAILEMGAFELIHRPDTPLRVILNEAVELAKTFGGTDGHKFINGVLDRLAQSVRPEDVQGGALRI